MKRPGGSGGGRKGRGGERPATGRRGRGSEARGRASESVEKKRPTTRAGRPSAKARPRPAPAFDGKAGRPERGGGGRKQRGGEREAGGRRGRGPETRERQFEPDTRKRPAAHGGRRPFAKAPPRYEAEPAPPPEAKIAPTFVSTGVQNVVVSADEGGMRVDRFIEARFPGLSFSHIQRVIRKGEVRVSGKRVDPKDRLTAGVGVRIPPFKQEPPKPRDDAPDDVKTRAYLKSITLYEDDDVMVLDKPYGLAVQGGSGTTRHIDGMLGSMRSRDGQRPRLVHRIDKDTSGCLLVAKNRFSAAALAKNFRSRSARKIYWALVVGVPKPKQGRISTFLAKEQLEEDSFMRVAQHGDEGAAHAVTYYAVVETAAQQLAWLSLKPVTGRTHQLRAHLDHIGHPIVGDPKYFDKENWQLPGGIQNRLHLLARRIVIPHPRGGTIDVTAPLPPHMTQSWNLLGFDLSRFDPIEQAPEEE